MCDSRACREAERRDVWPVGACTTVAALSHRANDVNEVSSSFWIDWDSIFFFFLHYDDCIHDLFSMEDSHSG